MSYLYKVILTKSPPSLYELIPPLQRSHRYPGCFKTLRSRNELFRNSFLPFTVNEWNKLDSDFKNSDSYAILGFSHNKLRLGFSHLREHKFRHNFDDTGNLLCPCTLETGNTEHFFYAAKTTYLLAQAL